jgi:hypothetical protein
MPGLGMKMRAMMARRRGVLPVLVLLALAGCNRAGSNTEPERVATPFTLPVQDSTLAVPVTARVVDLERLLKRRRVRNRVRCGAWAVNSTAPWHAGRFRCRRSMPMSSS